MAIKDCVDEIRKIAGHRLSDEDIQAVARDVERRAALKKNKDSLISDREALEAAAEDIAKESEIQKAIQARNRALDIIRSKARKDYYAQAEKDGYSPAQAIRGKLSGIERDIKGGGMSTDARGKALEGEFLGGLIGDLRKDGVDKVFAGRLGAFAEGTGIADKDLNRALWSIGEDGKVTYKTTPETVKVAQAINKWLEAARLRSNRAGAFIRKLPGYITRQSWDMAKIRALGKEEFTKLLMPLLDHDATFEGKDPAAFLSSAYDAMSTGVHIGDDGGNFGFKGPGNLAKKMSSERVLHFKDADSWTAANQAIGLNSTAEAVIAQLRHEGRQIALMETWGTNPEQNFADDLQMLKMQSRDNPKWTDELGDKGKSAILYGSLQDTFHTLDGSVNIADNTSMARWGSNIRGLQDVAKLPLAALSHLNLLATAASELQHEGESLGASYTKLFASFIENAPGHDRMGLVSDMGVAYESMAGSIASRFSSTDAQPGRMSRILRTYFKLNGMRFAIETSRSAFGQTIGANLGRDAALAFAKLDPAKRILLEHYGIDSAKWDVMRQGARVLQDGRTYLSPEGVKQLPDSAFAPLGGNTPRSAQSLRDDLTTTLRTYINDRTDHAVPTPGAREKTMMTRGSRPGTVSGEFARMIWQFKQFPLTLFTKVIQREFGKFQDGRGDILGVAHLIAATTVMGMFAMQAKQILKGRTPRDAFDGNWPQVWMAALQQGGGAGIYGDFLFGQVSDTGGSTLQTIAGPTIGSASQIFDTVRGLSQTKRNADGDLEPVTTKAELLKLGLDNMPNLFYTRLGLNYLILYKLQEMASPGYLARMQRRLKQQDNQRLIVPVSAQNPHGDLNQASF